MGQIAGFKKYMDMYVHLCVSHSEVGAKEQSGEPPSRNFQETEGYFIYLSLSRFSKLVIMSINENIRGITSPTVGIIKNHDISPS